MTSASSAAPMLDRLTDRLRSMVERALPWYDQEAVNTRMTETERQHAEAIGLRIDAEQAIRRVRNAYRRADERLHR